MPERISKIIVFSNDSDSVIIPKAIILLLIFWQNILFSEFNLFIRSLVNGIHLQDSTK